MYKKERVLRVRGSKKNVVSNLISCNHKYFISDINENFSIYFRKDVINLQRICKQSFPCNICSVTIIAVSFFSYFFLFTFLTVNCGTLVLSLLLQISPVTWEHIFFGNTGRVTTEKSE